MMANEAHLNSILNDVRAWNKWRSTNKQIEIDLRQANLNKAELENANLSYASLGHAKLQNTNLNQANLSQADLSNANLRQSNLTEANLRRANLTKTSLIAGNLKKADLRRADLRRANLSKANLNNARLNGTNLRGTNLCDADLTGANLVGTNLTGADLSGANLTGANLTGANLTGANFTEANLCKAEFIHSKLSGIIWTQALLEGTQFKDNTGLTKISIRAMQERGAIFILENALRKNYHFLVIEDREGRRSIPLKANTYIVGRGRDAGIRVYDPNVSRYHAFLRRLIDEEKQSFYHLVDGDLDGNRSKNGIKVNKSRCHSKILETGDMIQLGKTIIQYRSEELTPTELKQYFRDVPLAV